MTDWGRSAESSLLEISELQTQLATNLAYQNVHIDNLMQDSMQTQENLARGNKELKKAAEQSSVARTAFLATVVFSSVVFVWDWFI
jgi:syntaxin 18